MVKIELDDELYKKIEAYLASFEFDKTVDDFVNALVEMTFEDADQWMDTMERSSMRYMKQKVKVKE